jgi:hypothetical protein
MIALAASAFPWPGNQNPQQAHLLVSHAFWSCVHTEYSHILSVLPICDEFCESTDFAGNQEKGQRRGLLDGLLSRDDLGAQPWVKSRQWLFDG